MRPTFGNGKICHLEIPAVDVERSAITARFCDPAGNPFGLYQEHAGR